MKAKATYHPSGRGMKIDEKKKVSLLTINEGYYEIRTSIRVSYECGASHKRALRSILGRVGFGDFRVYTRIYTGIARLRARFLSKVRSAGLESRTGKDLTNFSRKLTKKKK